MKKERKKEKEIIRHQMSIDGKKRKKNGLLAEQIVFYMGKFLNYSSMTFEDWQRVFSIVSSFLLDELKKKSVVRSTNERTKNIDYLSD